jgi:hypothetical protein
VADSTIRFRSEASASRSNLPKFQPTEEWRK